jgi:hypothetical protein
VAERDYEYELRHGDAVVATGRLALEEPVEVGQRLTIGSQRGIVRGVTPALGDQLPRVIVELLPEGR